MLGVEVLLLVVVFVPGVEIQEMAIGAGIGLQIEWNGSKKGIGGNGWVQQARLNRNDGAVVYDANMVQNGFHSRVIYSRSIFNTHRQ